MKDETKRKRLAKVYERMYRVPMGVSVLLVIFAVIAQPDMSLLTGFWQIQISEAGLITDPVATGGVGAALLNAGLVMFVATLTVCFLQIPFTGVSLACMFMVGGFALLGKNLLNIAPFIFGGWLYTKYEQEPFSRYIYLTLFGTCLAPMASFFLNSAFPGLGIPLMLVCGVIIGFLLPSVAEFTVRIHQGYNLYNVGFAAGFMGLGIASLLKGVGVEFTSGTTWSQEGHTVLLILVLVILSVLLALGYALGCRSWKQYRRILRHAGRAVSDFVVLDGPGATLVNMALVGSIGLAYLLLIGVRLNGPLVCCLMSMMGFGAFGKHPKNVVPVMAGAILAALLLVELPLTAPGVLLATLLCSGLAPVSGQFGWHWGVIAGFLHMTIVQNTAILHGGMNLYNNGFAAGMVCILLIPIIEALKPEPEE